VSDVLAPTASALTEPSAFSYADLDSDVVRVAQNAAVSIRAIMRTSSLDVGRQLTTVKALLPHGQFTAWAEAELGITTRTAQNLMAAAGFVEGKPESVSLLPPTILYKLAAPSAPPELVQDVVEAAAAEAPLGAQSIKQRLEIAQLTRRKAAQHEKALKKAQRRNSKLTPEQFNARQDQERRRLEAQEAKQQAEQDRKHQERVARWRPIAERIAHAVADDTAMVRTMLGSGGWEDRQVLLAELLAALGSNAQIGA